MKFDMLHRIVAFWRFGWEGWRLYPVVMRARRKKSMKDTKATLFVCGKGMNQVMTCLGLIDDYSMFEPVITNKKLSVLNMHQMDRARRWDMLHYILNFRPVHTKDSAHEVMAKIMDYLVDDSYYVFIRVNL